ncbi:ParB/RepB/Spo0J family partition protein [Phycobacter azelaicus]|jgi:ParB family chromosome partitioning protein|uniref:ParB/RepB/Spo0J family partition protein n=1 Tax=Phycobacter azelaicus TaxID=2668075 RepID=UPI001866AF0D|nr:ParB/RepB/Spo0J family partition protein [Phycobacter azelaicus]MBE1294787.1 chromosome partitioning protein ParB [Paracoccaceae bacterium]
MTKTKSKAKTETSAQAAAVATIEMIPLSKLALSPMNVRKTQASPEADAELYASILETGLKQNLIVHKVGAKYHVHAGGRRLAALQKLKADGHVKASHAIPCQVEDKDVAEDTSAAENIVRAAMHPADQFEAFAALRAKGRTEQQIAAQFGITKNLVCQRLKLASVAPDLMQRFRDEDITLDCIMAFTLTDDHERQLEAWETVQKQYNPSAYAIRNHLTQKSYSGRSKLAKFVGVDAYKKAGGDVIEDLFSDNDSVHLKDPELLERLAQEKLDGIAEKAGKTWKWAEAHLETDYDSFRPYGRVYPQPLDPDTELEAEYEKLQARKEQLEADYDEATWTEALQEEEEQIWDRQREIEDIRDANVAFTQDDHAIAGCVVTINHAGEVTYHEGLVRAEDIPEPSQDASSDDAETGDSEDNVDAAGPTIELPQSMRSSSIPVDPTEAARKDQGIPRALADDLRASRHQILQAHLAADYATAYDTMLYAMALNALGHGGYKSPLDMSLRPAMTMGSKELLKETVASHMLDALNEGLSVSWMLLEQPEDFQAMCKLPDEEKQALFAWCTAYALKQQLSNDSQSNAAIEVIGERLSVDVAACWRPTSETYWARVKKDHALTTANSLIGERWSDDKSGLRKPELAKAMEQAFSDNPSEAAGLTPDSAAKTSRWLPDGMSFGDATDAVQDDAASNEADETAELPDYLKSEAA